MKKAVCLLVGLMSVQAAYAGSFIEETEPIEAKFIRKVKPLNQGISLSVDCGFFKEQERLCVFYKTNQIGPAGFLFRVEPTRQLVYLCEFYALSSYFCREACANPWPVFKGYSEGRLTRTEFLSKYRSYAKCVSNTLSKYGETEYPKGTEEIRKKYRGHLLNLKYFCLCVLKYTKNRDYDWLYSKLKSRFAKYDPKQFDKIVGVLKDRGKPEQERLYAFYPRFYDVYVNWLVSQGDDEMFKVFEKKGVEFWD